MFAEIHFFLISIKFELLRQLTRASPKGSLRDAQADPPVAPIGVLMGS